MGKVFTILNLLTFDRAKYMEKVICAAVHGQTASITDMVSVADAPFPPHRAFTHVKEAQTDTLHNVYALEHAMIV